MVRGEASTSAPDGGGAGSGGSGGGGGDALGVGMLGRGFMGRAHSIALRKLAWVAPELPLRLVALCARDREATTRMAREFGYERAVFDWQELIEDPAIGLVSNGGPNALHAAPTIAAARAGKHVLCEKPLGRDAQEAFAIWAAVERAGVVHMTGFNYRFFPAVALARQLIADGALGEIRHFRARYLQSWLVDPDAPATWRLDAQQAGAGALGDLGSHVVDLARHLVGEPAAVAARLATFVGERPGGAVDVDDAFAATVAFDNGAIGTLEGSRVAPGRKNQLAIEVNGTRGSLLFDQERKDELQLMTVGDAVSDGFRRIAVTEPAHPFLRTSWPAGHAIGWEDSFVFELAHLVGAIAGRHAVAPLGASAEDGYRCAEVCDAIARAARSGTEQQIAYRTLDEETAG
ncbi:Gfo/Idh/MocA family oxidoreductase [Conexibacter sp. JD483]|uniref:Gfo/Idh/MocA family protein n=1 Tax=unclassified Conexibacter TaxID=2627773 RepID=UPI002716E795|nr:MULTISPECIES: Gfo/Idh/MocA family oxidoreductase [unclassified Conexibacter]MDO8187574.1 Gfo/Idh/MocA family oxidoreductase [Conexibacter sp. CPCC 205706]MDO8198940.1 Gfo/Idh/MocA family oxidoreductase [Conexibacter sp. CPCC 205762]MDR9370353.1 Gfo/Idh/MocA family oxidoreductase [Conexibacter sp. JD483]